MTLPQPADILQMDTPHSNMSLILKKLNHLDTTLQGLSISFAEVRVRYETLDAAMRERNEARDRDSNEIKIRLESIEKRVADMEKFAWKLVGAVAATVLGVELFIKLF